MEKQVIYVVGNKFKQFAENNPVMLVDDFEMLMNIKNIEEALKNHYILGQGISLSKLNTLLEKIKANNLERYFSIEVQNIFNHKEKNETVHKHRSENVLISTPRKHNDSIYYSFLMVDDACAEMSDHVTGQHLQGMLLIEAARQMMTAVIEKYFLQADKQCNHRFILDRIESSFKQFLFPLEVVLKFEILKIAKTHNLGFKATALILFSQADKTVCEIIIDFSVLEKKFVESIEHRNVKDVLKYYCHNRQNIVDCVS